VLRIPSRRWGAIALLAITLGLMAAFLFARGSAAGADALAYWEGVRIWLAGGNPYDPPGLRLPYLYAPWLLPLFLPWAALPWPVAWFAWRAAMILGFGWSVAWAYRRRPGATAILVALLAIPLVATLDTGNVTLFLALGIWLAQFSGPRLGGALWALATAIKWVPIVLWPILPKSTRRWGLAGLALAVLLSLATWPQTLVQIQAAAASGPPNFPRPLRIDHAVLIWAAVPWLWRDDLRATVAAALRWRPTALRRAASASAPAADGARES
jgi:Glycosyltransferase family 87